MAVFNVAEAAKLTICFALNLLSRASNTKVVKKPKYSVKHPITVAWHTFTYLDTR